MLRRTMTISKRQSGVMFEHDVGNPAAIRGGSEFFREYLTGSVNR
jgi:hypothetical protein